MRRVGIIIVLILWFSNAFAQVTDTGNVFIKKYFAEVIGKPITNYTGAVVVLDIYSCGKGTLCGRELEEFTCKFATTTTMPVYVVLLGADSAVEKCLKKLPDVTFYNGDYETAQKYGLGFSVHHFYKLNNGVITFYAIPTKRNEKKVRKVFGG